jgi:histidinol-phosphate/aromatic aminotransferase/cobyric acid decarboxylase-like protein
LGGTALRVTIGLPQENLRFIESLQSVLALPQSKEKGLP